jgi:HlyD family secretion protein
LKISALGVEERRVNVLIDLDEPWQERQDLGDGFRVEAKILVDKTKLDVLIVPTSALESSDGKWYVYRVEKTFWQGHCVRRIEVETGLSNRINTEIISGLDLQDRIVLYPPETIQDGSWVTW